MHSFSMAINGVMWLMFADDDPIPLQIHCYPRAVSEISDEDSGSDVAASDFPTPPVESISVSYGNPEQVMMSETVTVTFEPESTMTSHQVVSS